MRQTALVLSFLALFGSCGSSGSEGRRWRDQVTVPPLEGLEAWINAREAGVAGLRPGVAAGIVWATPENPSKTPVSLVYLPGYTATRGEIAPTVDRIAQALGANVFYARPTGQGVGPDGHKTVTVDDWLRDGLEAFAVGSRLGDKVVLVGVSTGGALAAWLALTGAKPAASILISPNLTPVNKQTEMLLWPINEWLLTWMIGDTMAVKPENDLQARYWDTTHHSHSLIPMMQLVDKARTQDFRQWPSPVLVVYDPLDTVVNAAVTVKLFSRVPAGRLTLLEWTAAEGDNHHVLAGDALSPGGTDKMVQAALDFLKGVLGDEATSP